MPTRRLRVRRGHRHHPAPCRFLIHYWDHDAVMEAAVVLWWIQAALALACTLLLPFFMFTLHRWARQASCRHRATRRAAARDCAQASAWRPGVPPGDLSALLPSWPRAGAPLSFFPPGLSWRRCRRCGCCPSCPAWSPPAPAASSPGTPLSVRCAALAAGDASAACPLPRPAPLLAGAAASGIAAGQAAGAGNRRAAHHLLAFLVSTCS